MTACHASRCLGGITFTELTFDSLVSRKLLTKKAQSIKGSKSHSSSVCRRDEPTAILKVTEQLGTERSFIEIY